MNITNSVNESLVVGQAMNFSLLFLQSASLNTSEDQVNQYFNDTLNIANWFLSELIKEFDEDGTNTIATTTITQIYKAQDAIHIGWSIPLTINTFLNPDCC
jgi:hypothetical protein